jgi:hypothetical protein
LYTPAERRVRQACCHHLYNYESGFHYPVSRDTLSRNKSTVNEQIVEILIHSSIDNFQTGLQANSEQKADEMHVTPAIANARVGGSYSNLLRFK